jgi:parallel beta-helix repeat protein
MKYWKLIIGCTIPFLILIAGMAHSATITVGSVGADYASIQDAIGAANVSDVVEVHSGTYRENLNVTKQITLQGMDTGTGKPVVDGGFKDCVLSLSANGATVDGFIVKNSGSSKPGIIVASDGNTIVDCDISYNGRDGIHIENSYNNIINNNILSYNGRDGIYIKNANNNIIQDNIASYNSRYGFNVVDSSSNTLAANFANENKKGICLDHSNNNVVKDNELENNVDNGIRLDFSGSNRITYNEFSYNYNGIALSSSANNLVANNNAQYNVNYGIYLGDSSGNTLYLNNLVDNGRNSAFDNGDSNRWYSPELKKGNLYSNYDEPEENCTDLDKNGICDNPFSIPGGSGVDLYPLTNLENPTYPFLEVWTHEHGEAISGNPARIMIDFPTYSLENSSLVTFFPMELDPSLNTIIGIGSSLSGDLGGGASSILYQATELPYTADNFTILSMDENVLIADYFGERLVLGPGESWENVTEELETTELATLKVTRTRTVYNHGLVTLETDKLG